ncbi:MAG: hypothetical protein PHT94_04660 [Candidatus Nanoarchaeia archaeon]|nr:hypothetical protein [Candidatus Nanoarchaeia archaeon]
MFKNPFENKSDYVIIENMLNIIRDFCARYNNQVDVNLVNSMETLMKAKFDQFVTIFPNIKNDILRNYDKKDKEFLIAYFKVIEDQISQYQAKEVIEELDVEDIEKVQENMELTQEQIHATEELKNILKKEKEEETFKDEFGHFLNATKDLLTYPLHKHPENNVSQKNISQNNISQNNLVQQNNELNKIKLPEVSSQTSDEKQKNENKDELGDIKEDKENKKDEGKNIVKNINNENKSTTSQSENIEKSNQISEDESQKIVYINNVIEDKVSNPIVNLILSQLKDVVNMMNELSTKMKEVEKNNLTSVNQLSNLKENVKNYNDRILTLENNVEKFVGLYEVFMNEYNPFLDNESK